MTSTPRRVAVYNRYWNSRGGGERHSGMVAQVLSLDGAEVDLVSHTEVDRDALAKYLSLDLSRCRVRIVPDLGEDALGTLSADYDLLVNASYMSTIRSQAPHSLYLCYFPTPADHDLEAWRRLLIRGLGRFARPGPGFLSLRWGTGWFPPEGGRRRRWTWTNGAARIELPAGKPLAIRFAAARLAGPATELEVCVNDTLLHKVTAEATFRPVTVQIPGATEPRLIEFRSDTFVPSASDPRTLGVAISRLRFNDRVINPRHLLATRFPWLLRDPNDLAFLDTYDVVLANSQYTESWIRRLWNRESEVLYPPISVEHFTPAAERAPKIVSAGRFFAPGQGHSKRQLELVQAFGRLIRMGQLSGWSLHLVGGCDDAQRDYLARVRAAAAGLPVSFHVNAPRGELEELLSTASIQWSATGYGEDESKAPWASEHFGMTTVEAMAGGCVPIVIDKAGQREIVRDGIDGFRWRSIDELLARTLEVIRDPQLRERLSSCAQQRAETYSDAAFATGLRQLIDRYGLQ